MTDIRDRIDELKDEIFRLIKEEVKDLWKQEDEEFLKQLAEDIAREKELSKNSENPEEHERNLHHLAATLQGTVVKKQLQIKKKSQELFIRILVAVIKTIALSAIT